MVFLPPAAKRENLIDAEVKRRVKEGGGSSGDNGRRHHQERNNGQQHSSLFIQGMTRVSKQEFMSTFDNFGFWPPSNLLHQPPTRRRGANNLQSC